VVRVLLVLQRHMLEQSQLDRQRALAGRDAGAVGNAKNMGIDCNGRLAEGGIQHHVGGFAADTGQGFQFFARLRNVAAMARNQQARSLDQVFGLGAKQAYGLDKGNDAGHTQFEHFLRRRLAGEHGRHVPLAVKIAPDLADADIVNMAKQIVAHGIEGVIATNTTVSRAGVETLPHAAETGGLSGSPVAVRATEVIKILAAEMAGRVPIIGVGGIMNAADARAKIAAGASLVQIYTGLIYRGPALVGELARELADGL